MIKRLAIKRTRYYQGMIDLNILEKGDNYKDLKRSGEGLYDFADELSGKV